MTSIARTAAAKPGSALPELERAAIEAEIWRLATSDPGGWEAAVQRLVQAGDPATAYSLTRHDWYRLHDALVETILVCMLHAPQLFHRRSISTPLSPTTVATVYTDDNDQVTLM